MIRVVSIDQLSLEIKAKVVCRISDQLCENSFLEAVDSLEKQKIIDILFNEENFDDIDYDELDALKEKQILPLLDLINLKELIEIYIDYTSVEDLLDIIEEYCQEFKITLTLVAKEKKITKDQESSSSSFITFH